MYTTRSPKAFDTIPRLLILHKLPPLGVPHDVLGSLNVFVINRKQCVVPNGSKSYPINIHLESFYIGLITKKKVRELECRADIPKFFFFPYSIAECNFLSKDFVSAQTNGGFQINVKCFFLMFMLPCTANYSPLVSCLCAFLCGCNRTKILFFICIFVVVLLYERFLTANACMVTVRSPL